MSAHTPELGSSSFEAVLGSFYENLDSSARSPVVLKIALAEVLQAAIKGDGEVMAGAQVRLDEWSTKYSAFCVDMQPSGDSMVLESMADEVEQFLRSCEQAGDEADKKPNLIAKLTTYLVTGEGSNLTDEQRAEAIKLAKLQELTVKGSKKNVATLLKETLFDELAFWKVLGRAEFIERVLRVAVAAQLLTREEAVLFMSLRSSLRG